MQKTVREWGEELLPEPYKSQFMKNFNNPECNLEHGNELMRSKERFMSSAFAWERTPEGYDYWANVESWINSDSELPLAKLHTPTDNPITIKTTPTERQTAEALLKEFGDWFNSDKRLLIHNDAIQDFLTTKYGKG